MSIIVCVFSISNDLDFKISLYKKKDNINCPKINKLENISILWFVF